MVYDPDLEAAIEIAKQLNLGKTTRPGAPSEPVTTLRAGMDTGGVNEEEFLRRGERGLRSAARRHPYVPGMTQEPPTTVGEVWEPGPAEPATASDTDIYRPRGYEGDPRTEVQQDVDLAMSIIERDREDTRRQAEVLAATAKLGIEPGPAQEVQRLSVVFPDYTPDYIAKNLPAVRAEARAASFDWEEIVKYHPVYAKVVGDPRFATMAIDDTATLPWLEWAITGKWQSIPNLLPYGARAEFIDPSQVADTRPSMVIEPVWLAAARQWRADARLMVERGKRFMGWDPDRPRLGIEASAIIRDDPDKSITGDPEADKRLQALVDESSEGRDIIGTLGDGGVQRGRRLVADAFLLPIRMAPMIAGTIASGGAGGVALGSRFLGMAAFNTLYAAPGVYGSLESIKSPEGEGLPKGVARAATVAVSPLLGVLNSWALGPTFTGYAKTALERAGVSTIKRLMAEETMLRAMADFGVRTGAHMAEGATGFALQIALEDTAGQLASAWSFGTPMRPNEIANNMFGAFVKGFTDMSVLAAWGGGRGLLRDMGMLKRASETQLRWKIMSDAATAAKHPEVVEEMHRQSAAVPGSATKAYVDLQTFQQVAMEAGLDPRDAAARIMGDDGAHYDEVVRTHAADLVIPLEKAQKMLRNKIFGPMLEAEGRFDPSDVSFGKMAREAKRWAKLAQESTQLTLEQMDPEQRAIYDKEVKRLLAAQEFANSRFSGDRDEVADATARMVLGLVTAFRERTGRTESLTAWYERTLGQVGVWGARQGIRGDVTVPGDPGAEAARSLGASQSSFHTIWRGYALGKISSRAKPFIFISDRHGPLTPIHEFVHQFHFSVINEVAARPELQKLADDLAAGLGFKDHADFRTQIAAGADAAKVLERLARGFEQWVMNGVSPSLRLAPVFAKFMHLAAESARMGRTMGDALWREKFGTAGEVALTPALRTFFERLLATPEEIKLAQEFVKAGLPFVIATKNMTPEQKAEYAKLLEDGEFSAHDLLLKMIVEGTRRENRAFLKRMLAKYEVIVRGEAEAMPIYEAARAYRGKDGTSPARRALLTAPDGRLVRFSADELRGLFGKEAKEVIDLIKERFGEKAVTEGGAEDPNAMGAYQLANALGFPDTANTAARGLDHLVSDLRNLPDEGQYVKDEALRRLRGRFATDLIDQPEALQAAAISAVLNEKMAKKIIAEMNALARDVGDPDRIARMRSLTPERMRDLARALLQSKALGRIRPEMFARSVATASVKAREAAKGGDLGAAWDNSEGALLNFYLYHEAVKLDADLAKAYEKLAGAATSAEWRSKLGLADPENPVHLRANDAILKSIGLMQMRDGERPAGAGVIDDLLASVKDHGQEMLVDGWDEALLKDVLSGAKKWDDLLPDEANQIYNAILNIRRIAADLRELRVGDQIMELDQAVGELQHDLSLLPFKGKAPADMTLVPGIREPGLKLQGLFATAEDFNTLTSLIGPSARKFLWDTYISRRNWGFDLEKKVVETMKAGWEKLPKEVRDSFLDEITELERRLPIPDDVNLSGPRSRGWLVMVMMNMGNEGNRSRLLRGMGWVPEDVHAMAEKYLSPEIMNYVQEVWDLHENVLWPLISAKEARKKGLAPEKVDAAPFKLTFGGKEYTYRGGYFHARYDTRAGAKPLELQAEATEDGPVRMKPMTVKGYTHGRAANYADVMDLNWGVLPQHISEVIHDLAFDEWVSAANKLIFNKKFGIPAAMYQRLGEERAKQPRAFLEATARGSQPVAAELARTMGLLEAGRARIVQGVLGYNVPIVMADFLHPVAVALFGKVSMPDMAAVVAALPFNYSSMRAFAIARSKELQLREFRQDPKLREQILVAMRGGQHGLRKPLDWVQRHAFDLLNAGDRYNSTAVWTAKFREVMRKTHDEATAIKEADDAVNSSMPTHMLNELPTILRDHRTIGSLLIFQGYWNKLFQISRVKAHEAYKAWHDPNESVGSAMATTGAAAMRIMAGLAVSSVLGDWVMGHGKEEDEEWGQWWGRKLTVAPFALLPFGANIAEPLADVAWTGKVRSISVRQAPFLASLQQVYTTVGRLASDTRETDQKVWDVIEAALFTARLPYRQPRRTGEFLTNLLEGDETVDDPFALGSGLLYGKRKRQATNPLYWGD